MGKEARAAHDDHADVKLWLRLLTCSTHIEQAIRTRLRAEFGTTLARFDYLAQLHRHPEGLRMNVLSRCLMVTGGNVTGLTDQLVADGWVKRSAHPEDRRSALVRLTAAGRKQFLIMAEEHEKWLVHWFAGVDARSKARLYSDLGQLRAQFDGK